MYYYKANDYYKHRFGSKIYKISLSSGLSCPNRDGKLGKGGCIFCSEGGSGEFAAKAVMPIDEQIDCAIDKIKNKIKSNRYIAYFQSFSNTYGDTEYLRKIFTAALSDKRIVALSVATRPDCFNDDIYELLDKLNHIKPVFVELGLQTSDEASAKYIRRGYENSTFDLCCKRLHKININIIAHIILGLPGESFEKMKKSVVYACERVDGIKLQLLHVLKNTDLAQDYYNHKFETMSLEEYVDILCRLIEYVPQNIVIHRITGDGPKALLIAPLWSGNKKYVLNRINKEFNERDVVQGAKLRTDPFTQ